jgi:hypothetical protein
MQDDAIVHRISQLVDREHELRTSIAETASGDAGADPEAQESLAAIEVQLDQCWDLLRQRRARREFGADPDAAHVRDEGTVEHYRQ